jgi:4-hydroxyphenylpyruvate dioxygenase
VREHFATNTATFGGTLADKIQATARAGFAPAHVVAAIPPDRVFLVQVADAYMVPGIETIETARHHRVFPGEGDLDVAGLVRTLREAGYAGRYSLEIFNDGYRAEPANVVAKRAMQSLEVLFAKTAPRLAQPQDHPLEMTCGDQ